jgi:hypothetical protein
VLEVIRQYLFGEADGVVHVEKCASHVPGDVGLDARVFEHGEKLLDKSALGKLLNIREKGGAFTSILAFLRMGEEVM